MYLKFMIPIKKTYIWSDKCDDFNKMVIFKHKGIDFTFLFNIQNIIKYDKPFEVFKDYIANFFCSTSKIELHVNDLT